MQILVLGLCLALAFVHGASSQLVPESVVTTLIEQDNSTQKYKRQTTAQLQCVSNRLDVIFRGNNASFVSQCKSVAVAQVQLDVSNPSRAQAQISPFYRAYCNHECGDAINDAYNECGAYSSAPAGTETLNIGLCGTNEDGNICYQLYGDGLTIVRTEASCYNTYISRRVCTCRSALSEAGDRQGCCLDVYHNFISGLGPSAYNPSVLYNACNVGRQSSCTNNPFFVPTAPRPTTADDSDSDSSNSSSGATSFTSTVTAIIAYSFLYAMF